MRKNDFTNEWVTSSKLLGLRPGDTVLDAQTDGDALLPLLEQEVGERGLCIGMAFGQAAVTKAQELVDVHGMNGTIVAAHPIKTPFKNNCFHGVIMRHTSGFPALEPIIQETYRITKSGGKILFMHNDWEIDYKTNNELYKSMIEQIKKGCCKSGRDFQNKIVQFKKAEWREVRLEVFVLADKLNQKRRYDYDWRTLTKDILARSRKFENKDILNFISDIEQDKEASVNISRYVCLAIKA